MTKVLYNGEEIELVDKLEKGEEELDLLDPNDTLEDTLEIPIKEIEKKKEELDNTIEVTNGNGN